VLEETVVVQRLVYGAIHTAGLDVKNLHVDPKMFANVRQSHAVYKRNSLWNVKNSFNPPEQQNNLQLHDRKTENTEIINKIA